MSKSLSNHYEEGRNKMTIQSHVVSLTSDSSGNATGSVSVSGRVIQLVNVPSSTAAPSASYDIAVTDAFGTAIYTDTAVLATGNSVFFPWITTTGTKTDSPYCVVGKVNIVGANMGASKSAQVVIFVEGT